jgi:protein O-mannosyl-transferase
VLGFVRFDFQKYSTVADHYLYVAMFGPALIAAAIAGKINSSRTSLFSEDPLHSIDDSSTNLHPDRKINRSGNYLFPFAAGIVLVACGVGSVRQARHWRDSQSIFAHTLRVNPRSFAARGVLGYLAREQGDNVRASDHYVAALVIYPDDATTNFNLARVLVDLGQFDRAIRHFERALVAKPDDPQFRNNYGVALFLAGRFDEAEAQLRAVLAKHPDFADAATNLAKFRDASRPASRPAP